MNPIFVQTRAVSSFRDAVLRRIGFSAPRCSFFRSRRQISSKRRFERIFGPTVRTRAVIAQFCRQIGVSVRRDLRANSGRDSGHNSGRNSVHTLIAKIFLRTSVLYPWRRLAVFLAIRCVASCEGDLLSRILRRDIIHVSVNTDSF